MYPMQLTSKRFICALKTFLPKASFLLLTLRIQCVDYDFLEQVNHLIVQWSLMHRNPKTSDMNLS